MKMMAEKKHPGDEQGFEKLKAKILETGGPVAHGVTVRTLPVYLIYTVKIIRIGLYTDILWRVFHILTELRF